MREIKFRSFQKDGDKSWMYFWKINEIDAMLETDREIMQYTGLKDKNGKEIYKWDILHEYKERTAPMAENGIDRTFIVDDIRALDFSPIFCEVIGNIYENEELINNQSK